MMMPPKMLMAVMIRPAMASPRTNFEAPSIEPKNELSSSSSQRRCWAVFSSINPADRSASIDICLPGMASRVKRAPTSAMRVAPLVITMKLTTTRMRKTIRPMTKSPDMTSCEKPPMTWPAAVMPSCPSDRIMRVVAMLSDNRVIVAISRMVGKEEKSNGRWIHNATIRINTEKAMEKASPMSIRNAGIGRNRIDRMITMPMAKVTSRPRPSSGGIAIACVCAMDHPERKIGETNCVRLVTEACARVTEDDRKEEYLSLQ